MRQVSCHASLGFLTIYIHYALRSPPRLTRNLFAYPFLLLRQHRIIPAHRLRRQNFRQIVQKTQVILCVLPSIFGRYDGTFCKQNVCRELCGVAIKNTARAEKPVL